MTHIIYGVLAVFGVMLIADMLAAGIKQLIDRFSGSETPLWAERFLAIARRWGDW
jgi:hypothetical protein